MSITASHFISSAGCPAAVFRQPNGPGVGGVEGSAGSHRCPAGGEPLSAGWPLALPSPDCHLRGGCRRRGGGGLRHLHRFFTSAPEQRLHLYHRCSSVSAARSRVRTEFAMELAAARLEIEINVAGWGWRGRGRQLSSPTASSCVSHKPLKSSISRRLNPLDLPFLSPHNELFTFNYLASGVAQSQDIVARVQQHTHTHSHTHAQKKKSPSLQKTNASCLPF